MRKLAPKSQGCKYSIVALARSVGMPSQALLWWGWMRLFHPEVFFHKLSFWTCWVEPHVWSHRSLSYKWSRYGLPNPSPPSLFMLFSVSSLPHPTIVKPWPEDRWQKGTELSSGFFQKPNFWEVKYVHCFIKGHCIFSLPGLHHVPVSVRHGLVCRALWPPGKGRGGKRLDFI